MTADGFSDPCCGHRRWRPCRCAGQADQGPYFGLESSFYRVLPAKGQKSIDGVERGFHRHPDPGQGSRPQTRSKSGAAGAPNGSNGVRLLRWKPAERIHHLEPIHHLLLASPKIGLDHQLHGRRTPGKAACFESGSLTRSS